MTFFKRSTHDSVRGLRAKATLLAGALGLVFVLACQDASVAPNTTAVAGTYILTTVNDTALPRTIQQQTNYSLSIVDDTLALSTFGTWADLTVYSETSGTVTAPNSSLTYGTFTTDGATVNFKTYAGDTFTGSVSSGTLLITGTNRALYVKH